MSSPVLQLRGVCKDYGTDVVVRVLHDVDLELHPGELASLIGPSGSGKSTLLNIIGLLDKPTAGHVEVMGTATVGLDDEGLTALRGSRLGFIFQFHHLIGALSAVENVMVPLSIARGSTRSEHRERAREALALVGLAERADSLPRQLSGGQQQRVAIARALVSEPALVLADEPTGNLDSATSEEVFALMEKLNRELSTAFLIVTHDSRIADRTRRVIELVDGRIIRDEPTAGG